MIWPAMLPVSSSNKLPEVRRVIGPVGAAFATRRRAAGASPAAALAAALASAGAAFAAAALASASGLGSGCVCEQFHRKFTELVYRSSRADSAGNG